MFVQLFSCRMKYILPGYCKQYQQITLTRLCIHQWQKNVTNKSKYLRIGWELGAWHHHQQNIKQTSEKKRKEMEKKMAGKRLSLRSIRIAQHLWSIYLNWLLLATLIVTFNRDYLDRKSSNMKKFTLCLTCETHTLKYIPADSCLISFSFHWRCCQ